MLAANKNLEYSNKFTEENLLKNKLKFFVYIYFNAIIVITNVNLSFWYIPAMLFDWVYFVTVWSGQNFKTKQTLETTSHITMFVPYVAISISTFRKFFETVLAFDFCSLNHLKTEINLDFKFWFIVNTLAK